MPYLSLLDGVACIWEVSNSQRDHKGRLFLVSTKFVLRSIKIAIDYVEVVQHINLL
jgi:hypothetical protein